MGKLNHGNVKAHILRNSLKFHNPPFWVPGYIQTPPNFHSQSWKWTATSEGIHTLKIVCSWSQIKYLKAKPTLENLNRNLPKKTWLETTNSSALSTTSDRARLCLARASQKLHTVEELDRVIRLLEASITWLSSTVSCKWKYYQSESFPDQNNLNSHIKIECWREICTVIMFNRNSKFLSKTTE